MKDWFYNTNLYYKVNGFYHYWMNRLWRKFNHIHIKTLDEQWHDSDDLMLHAMFQILTNFVELERPKEVTDWGYDEEHRKAWTEIETLYRWWKEERPERYDPIFDVESPEWISTPLNDDSGCSELKFPDDENTKNFMEASKKSWELDEQWYKQDEEMMVRLTNIRRYLWT